MSREHRSEQLGMSVIWPAGCRASGMPGPVIEKDSGKGSLAVGVEDPSAKFETVTWHDYGFRFSGSSALGD
jgi:hypothetical protein